MKGLNFNRKNTFDLFMSLDNMLIREWVVLNDVLVRFIFIPFFNWEKVKQRHFQTNYIYKEWIDFKLISNYLVQTRKIKRKDWYLVKYKTRKPWIRRILWLMYEYYNLEWFKIVEDISYENIWLKQFYENWFYWLDFLIKKVWNFKENWQELQKFSVPKIFIENDEIYEFV